MPPSIPCRLRFISSISIAALAPCTLVGCSSPNNATRESTQVTQVQIGDFRSDTPRNASASAAPVVINDPTETETQQAPQTPTAQADPNQSTAAGRSIVLENGLSFIDAKVGDINGKPIYVSSFFAPIERRLISLAERESPQQWQRSMGEIVNTRLNSIMFDELLRSETLSALTPQNRVGLQSFLENFRDELISQNLGSAQLANDRLLKEQGITLDQALKQKELDTLVAITLNDNVNRRVNVSWRDIQNRYERDFKRFNPPPTIDLRVIRILGADESTTQALTERLNAGESFEDIAGSDLNSFNRDTNGILSVEIDGSIDETNFFGPAALNEAARSLAEGDWTGPIELGSNAFWIKHDQTRQESRSLYDAQIQIKREIEIERRESERAEYLSDLIERAKITSREDILLRLFSVATRLYGPVQAESP